MLLCCSHATFVFFILHGHNQFGVGLTAVERELAPVLPGPRARPSTGPDFLLREQASTKAKVTQTSGCYFLFNLRQAMRWQWHGSLTGALAEDVMLSQQKQADIRTEQQRVSYHAISAESPASSTTTRRRPWVGYYDPLLSALFPDH